MEDNHTTERRNVMQCEGWRRTGGAFTFGPVIWKRCKNDAIVNLIVTQDNKTETLPACAKCWEEAKDNKIAIEDVVPLEQPPQKGGDAEKCIIALQERIEALEKAQKHLDFIDERLNTLWDDYRQRPAPKGE